MLWLGSVEKIQAWNVEEAKYRLDGNETVHYRIMSWDDSRYLLVNVENERMWREVISLRRTGWMKYLSH